MQDFDLLEFLSHNYISLGTLANQNMWRSYCYGDLNIWWWHLQEETNMPFGNTNYQFTENNRYRVSLTLLGSEDIDLLTTDYLYIEDLSLSKVHAYVASSICENTFTGFLLPNNMFQDLNIELLNANSELLHSYTWGTDMVILKGKQLFYDDDIGLVKTILIFDKNAALLYLYDSKNTKEIIICFLAFSEQSNEIVGMEYDTSEVTNITNADNPPSGRLATGLNNTHTYIYNMISDINTVRLHRNNNTMTYNDVYTPVSELIRPLGDDFSWTILFFFRPTPVSCSAPTNCNLLLPINQYFTGQHGPVTIWQLEDGLHLSIDCGQETTYPFILAALIASRNNQYFREVGDGFTSLYVGSNYDIQYPNGIIALHGNDVLYTKRYDETTTTQNLCGVEFKSLFHYHGNNAEPVIWLFHYDNSDNSSKAHVIYAENMDDYAHLITDDYGIANIWTVGIYDQMWVASEERFNVASYLNTGDYYTHLTQFFIFNTLAHTAPQVVNGSWSYIHYLRFVLDDYTSSNLRIPLAIVEGDIRRNNIKYREISIDKMSASQRYPIVRLSSLSKAHMPDVILDGYIASLNADAGKNEDSTFGTLMPYYDLREGTIQEPHPEWYFRLHIHAGTWHYIFKDITSSTQMKTYRIQHNDGSLRIVLDVGLYFEIITEHTSNNNKRYTIVYADIFPSVYWCYGNESYEFLNVNVEWIQCRYSMPGKSMIRSRLSNNVISRPVAIY
jgi:hypothetical protein